MMLFKEAQHQSELIHQSISDRTGYKFHISELDPDPDRGGDLATFLADQVAGVMRENVTNTQTVREVLSEQFPEVHWTVDWSEAIPYVSAMIRQEFITGIIVGLQLAGVMPEPKMQPRKSSS
jgi:hypothetical protein